MMKQGRCRLENPRRTVTHMQWKIKKPMRSSLLFQKFRPSSILTGCAVEQCVSHSFHTFHACRGIKTIPLHCCSKRHTGTYVSVLILSPVYFPPGHLLTLWDTLCLPFSFLRLKQSCWTLLFLFLKCDGSRVLPFFCLYLSIIFIF